MEIRFKRDTTFRKQFFVADSFAHPAKMDAQLLIWIVEKYTKPGEIILDPMAGCGTSMLGCMLGRNVILVDIEGRFVQMCRDNWEQVRMRPQLGYEMGTCQIIQGDARNLEGLLVDKIISSQPYPAQSPPHTKEGEALRLEIAKERGVSPDKVSLLDYTKGADKIITSPPFQEADIQRPGKAQSVKDYQYGSKQKHQGISPDNIANLAERNYGDIDSIITSPPYEGSLESSTRHTKGGIADRDKKLTQTGTYAKIDTVVTSPPYEEAESRDRTPYQGGRVSAQMKYSYLKSKTDNLSNIGNLKGETYLAAMLQVYQQCLKVLKAGGLMILVTKNFIREKKVVRLDLDTIKLCEKVGFMFIERHFRKLPGQSFWRITYKKKYPGVETLDTEEVMVFQRPQEVPEGF